MRQRGPLISLGLGALIITALLVLVDPPSDVQARITRPFISSVNACKSELVTVDVAGKRTVSRIERRTLFNQATDLGVYNPSIRIHSVEDQTKTKFLVLLDGNTGVVSFSAFDPDGLPIGRSNSNSLQQQPSILSFTLPSTLIVGSDLVLEPVANGFFMFVALATGTYALHLDLESFKGAKQEPKLTPIDGLDISRSTFGFAAGLGNDLIISSSDTQVMRLANGGNSKNLSVITTRVQFSGFPLLATSGQEVFAVVKNGRVSNLVKWRAEEKWSTKSQPEFVALLGENASVIARSASSSETPAFLLDTSNGKLMVAVSAEGQIRKTSMPELPTGDALAVVSDSHANLVLYKSEDGQLKYLVVLPDRVLNIDFNGSYCSQSFRSVLTPEWLNSLATGLARPVIAGPYIYASNPLGTFDCIVDTRLRETSASFSCTSGAPNAVDKNQGLVIDPMQQQALLADGIPKPVTSTTIPVTSTGTTIPKQSEQVQSPSSRCIAAKNPTAVAPTVIPPSDTPDLQGSFGYTRADNGGSVTVALSWTSLTDCQPQTITVHACVANDSETECQGGISKTTYEVGLYRLSSVFEIGGLPVKAGKKHLVWAVGRLFNRESPPSNTVLVNVPNSGVCAPGKVTAQLSVDGKKWTVAWENPADNCNDSDPIGYLVSVIDCAGREKTNAQRTINVAQGQNNELKTEIKTNGDQDFDLNMRGLSVGFRIRSFNIQSNDDPNPGARITSAPVETKKCQESTTTAIDSATTKQLSIGYSALPSKHIVSLSGLSTNGYLNFVGLYQTLGTSTFDELCMALSLNRLVKSSSTCLPASALEEPFSATIERVDCKVGEWQLLLSPRRSSIVMQPQVASVDVKLDCESIFTSKSETTVSQVGTSSTLEEEIWNVSAVVKDLGVDYISNNESTSAKVTAVCDTWLGPEIIEGDLLETVADSSTGAATLSVNFRKMPAVINPAGSCILKVSVGAETSTSPLSIANLSNKIALSVSKVVAARITATSGQGIFSRTYENSRAKNILKIGEISCPTSTFAVSITIGNSNIPCATSPTVLTWESSIATDSNPFPYEIIVSTATSGPINRSNYSVAVAADNEVGLHCLQQIAGGTPGLKHNFCSDPSAAFISAVNTSGSSTSWSLQVEGSFEGLNNSNDAHRAMVRICDSQSDSAVCVYEVINYSGNPNVALKPVGSPRMLSLTAMYVTFGYCTAVDKCADDFKATSNQFQVSSPPP